jgi:hypothetical protein
MEMCPICKQQKENFADITVDNEPVLRVCTECRENHYIIAEFLVEQVATTLLNIAPALSPKDAGAVTGAVRMMLAVQRLFVPELQKYDEIRTRSKLGQYTGLSLADVGRIYGLDSDLFRRGRP